MNPSSEFKKHGRLLWEAGLVHFTSGNLSIRRGKEVYVTRTGRSLSGLGPKDIVRVNLNDARRDAGASSEIPVHRALYQALPGIGAVAHAHPAYATTLSFSMNRVVTVDSDSLYIPEVPVLTACAFGEGSACVARHLPKLMAQHPVGLIRGHGAFAVGEDLAQCVGRLTMMENQCRLIFLRAQFESRAGDVIHGR